MSPFAQWTDRFSAHVGFLFTEQIFGDRFSAARRAGFRAVEHPNPFAMPAHELAKRLDGEGLVFVQTSFPAGDAAKGEKGFAALRDQIDRFRTQVMPTLDYASEIGCTMVHAMAAVRPAGAEDAHLLDIYRENVAFAADRAAEYGITLIIEPIGPGSVANYLIDDPHTALDVIRTVGRSNVGLLLDLYHLAILGHDPVPLVQANGPLIRHVQIADHPGRHEPGSGGIDFRPALNALTTIGYAGHVGCEYHPAHGTVAGLGWLPGQAAETPAMPLRRQS